MAENEKLKEVSIDDVSHMPITKYFSLIESDEKIDAEYNKSPRYVNISDLIKTEMNNPNMLVWDFLVQLYRPSIVLQNEEKKIKHYFIQGLETAIEEEKSIGFLEWDGKIIGCAKARLITNPVPLNLQVERLSDIEGDSFTLTESYSMSNFIKSEAWKYRYFETIHTTPAFRKALESKDITTLYKNKYPNFSNYNKSLEINRA